MRHWLGGWRLAVRLARRDLLKHRSRAAIALVMIALPVLAVVAADVLAQTAGPSAEESVDRRIGTAATAYLRVADGQVKVTQSPDPQQAQSGGDEKLPRPTTEADIEGVLGHRELLPIRTHTDSSAEALVHTEHGRETAAVTEVDPTAPLARGLFRLADGRWPSGEGEVAINAALRDRGVGDRLTVLGPDGQETTREIVGTVVDATFRDRSVILAMPGTLPLMDASDPGTRAWLVDGPGLTWEQVEALNALGVFVTDRHIVLHPEDYPDPLGYEGGSGDDLEILALVVVMALIEVVLLAGPAFAVGARKQQHSLALLAASGGTPQQSRRVIVAGGLVLGLTAALVGAAGGILAAWLLQPLAQRFNDRWIGSFDVAPLHVLGIAVFGLVSAVIACVVPAWIASRQNVVAVLAGRRGDPKPGRAFPVLGAVLFGIGILMAVLGARGTGGMLVAWSAVVCVLGMVLLVPVVVSALARVAGRFPLPVRFAARDAVRHRIRTTSAVAAVAATVAGAVALGIGNASDEKENRETYTANLLMGDAAVVPSQDYVLGTPAPTDWDRVEAVVRRHVGPARVARVVGVSQEETRDSWLDILFTERSDEEHWIAPEWSTSSLGSNYLVSDGSDLPALVTDAYPDAAADLAAGRAVVFGGREEQARTDELRLQVTATDADGEPQPRADLVVPARVVPTGRQQMSVSAVLPPTVAKKAGLTTSVVGLDVSAPELSKTAEQDLQAALQDLPTPASVTVERGYQAEPFTRIVRWILVGLAAILMLGGTLTAMFLALADARPDLATLAAVGAAPRTRRSVGAAYTFVVAFAGAVLGMLVGFVPGIAITWPLTTSGWQGTGPYLEIPWLMIAVIVVGLPLLTAGVVGLLTRSRLPMVGRIS
jgi:putative ABC transport system permease protein